MTVGLSVTIANAVLDSLFSGAAWTPPVASYVQVHVGDPGPNGTANVSSYTTRTVLAWSPAAGGSKSITATITITNSWSGASPETIGYVSYWDSATAGTFVTSDQLAAPVTVVTGSPLTIPSLVAPMSPIAA